MKKILLVLAVVISFHSLGATRITPNEEARNKIEIRDLARELNKELRITLLQYVNATGVNKINLNDKINEIRYELAILHGKKPSCK